MIKFSKDKVLLLHKLIVQETGGSADVRDFALLESALESAYATFDGKDLYPTRVEKAAKIGYSLIGNHSFIDGNKRIGMYVMLSFLEVNGLQVSTSDENVIKIGMGVASGEINYEELLQWIRSIT